MNAQVILKKAKLRAKQSGLSYRQIGVKMGYPPASARQSVSQFLNGANSSLETLLRFCKAIELDPREVL